MSAAKEKAVQFIADYQTQSQTIQDKIQEAATRLEDLSLEINFINEKELPEAIERRVLSGDKAQENRVRKLLDKLQAEKNEKAEDLLVMQQALQKHLLKAAEEVQAVQRLFRAERGAVATDTFKRLGKAREAYVSALKDTEILHQYKEIERQIVEVETNAGRRASVSDFPIHQLQINELEITRFDVAKILKRLP